MTLAAHDRSLNADTSAVRSTPVGLVLFALAMGGFAIGTTEFAAMSLLPYFSAGLGIDEPTGGHVISIYALGVVVGAPLIAVLAARNSAPHAADRSYGRLRDRKRPERAGAELSLDARLPLPQRLAAWRLFRRRGTGGRLALGSEPARAIGGAGHAGPDDRDDPRRSRRS